MIERIDLIASLLTAGVKLTKKLPLRLFAFRGLIYWIKIFLSMARSQPVVKLRLFRADLYLLWLLCSTLCHVKFLLFLKK
jgi:hypothetical protein